MTRVFLFSQARIEELEEELEAERQARAKVSAQVLLIIKTFRGGSRIFIWGGGGALKGPGSSRF